MVLSPIYINRLTIQSLKAKYGTAVQNKISVKSLECCLGVHVLFADVGQCIDNRINDLLRNSVQS